MSKFGLLGYPLGHSLSGFIHRKIFERCGLSDYSYTLCEVKPEELSLKGGCIKELNGFNVTIPYKTEIIPYINRLDKSAAMYGSVNCVKLDETSGEYVGYNTDGYGFLKSVDVLGASLKSKVLLLGCGGTGRMMAFEAVRAGADLTVVIRRTPTAEKAAAKLSQDINKLTGKFSTKVPIGQTAALDYVANSAKMRITYADMLTNTNKYDLLLNATPSGMYPNTDEMPINPEFLKNTRFLFDAVYNPSPTKLVEEARKRSVKAMNGLVMLVYQAVMAEILWNDIKITQNDIDDIIKELEAQLQCK